MRRHLVWLFGFVYALSHCSMGSAATSVWVGGNGSDYNTLSNWSAGIPVDDASFNTATPTDISISVFNQVNSLTFNLGASAYTLNIMLNSSAFQINGAGIINNSGLAQTLINHNNNSDIQFGNSATAGNAVISNLGGQLDFYATTDAGTSTITNAGGIVRFHDNSTLGNSTLINSNGGTIDFLNDLRGGHASITNDAGSTIILTNQARLNRDTVINNGTINIGGASTLGSAAVINNGSINLVNFSMTIWTVGSISGSGNFNLGATTMQVFSDQHTTVTGSITGAGGSLMKFGGGTLTLAGLNTYTGGTDISQGTLNLQSSLPGDVTVESGGRLSGTGTVFGNVLNNGTVLPGDSGIGTLTATSYTGTGIQYAAFHGTLHGALNISQSANIAGGQLFVLGSNFGSNFAVGQYSVLHASSLTGTFSTVFLPVEPLLSFTTSYTPTDIFLQINFATPFLPFAQTANQRSLAANLNGFKMTSTADFTNAINSLSLLSAAQIPGAFNQLSGDALASFQGVGLQNAAVFTKGMRQRAVSVSSGTNGLWAQGVGYVDNMSGDPSIGSPAFNATTGGFQAGYDEILAEDLKCGISGGYAKTNLDVTDRASSGNTTTLQSGIYAGYTHESWFANGAAAYTAESNDMTRPINFSGLNEQASSNFKSRLYTLLLETGYTFRLNKTLSFEPSFSLMENYLSQDGFTETGAPGLGLTVADQSLNSFVSSLGVGLRRSFLQDSSHPLDMHVGVAWEHELGNTSDELSAQFAETSGGSNFTVQGTPRSRDAAAIGLEGRMPLKSNTELFLSYSATLASVETMQKLFGGARYKW